MPLAAVEGAVLEEIERVRRQGVDASEVARARHQLRARLVFDNDGVTNIAHQLGYFETVTGPGYLSTLQQRIDAVTPEQVWDVARQRLTPEQSDGRLVPARGTSVMSPTLATGLSPVRETLGNGATVIVQETVATPAVSISAQFQAGSLYEPPDIAGTGVSDCPGYRSGTARRAADDIAEELDKRGVSLRIGTTRHTLTFSSTCLADDFDDRARSDDRRGTASSLPRGGGRRSDEPNRSRSWVRTRTIPRFAPFKRCRRCSMGPITLMDGPQRGRSHDLGRLDRDALVRFHAEHVRPAALSLVIVGDVEASTAFDRARSSLEDWCGDPERAVVVPPPAMDAVRRIRQIPMAGKSQTDIAYGFTTISRLDPRYYCVLDAQQHPRAVRAWRTARRQHPRAAGDGVLRVQRVRCDGWGQPARYQGGR